MPKHKKKKPKRGTRTLRRIAHNKFDVLWRDPHAMNRADAYEWLSEKTGIPPDRCHFSMFNRSTLKSIIRLLSSYEGE